MKTLLLATDDDKTGSGCAAAATAVLVRPIHTAGAFRRKISESIGIAATRYRKHQTARRQSGPKVGYLIFGYYTDSCRSNWMKRSRKSKRELLSRGGRYRFFLFCCLSRVFTASYFKRLQIALLWLTKIADLSLSGDARRRRWFHSGLGRWQAT